MSRSPVGALQALIGSLPGGAVRNARESLERIACAIAERVSPLEQQESGQEGDLQRLSRATCLELLCSRSTGRLAYAARAGAPDIVPVNYVLNGDVLLIRSGPGPKLQAAERRELVAFEVDDVDEVTHAGWSVVVTGRAERLSSTDATAGRLPVPFAGGVRRHVVRISIDHLEGRRLLGALDAVDGPLSGSR